MKMVRNITILVGLSVGVLALGAAEAKAQASFSTRLVGSFTLPFEAQWGALTLPAGDYTLRYDIQDNGRGLVVVRGTAKGGPYGMILAGSPNDVSATKNAIVCVREGKALIVRALEMPAIGESVRFALPHGVDVEARILRSKLDHNANTQLTEVRIPIERVPVKANGK